MRKVIITLGIALLCAISFCVGRYDYNYIKHGIFISYEDQRNCMIDEATIFEDIFNDIYEIDGTYFENIIETDSNYNKLIDHYNKWEGKADWDWESMYNL